MQKQLLVIRYPIWAVLLWEMVISPGAVQASLPQTSLELSPATTVEEWVAQIAQSLTQVTGVRLNSTADRLEIVLETADFPVEVPTPSVVGNALVADIPNAKLALPEGDEFQATNPIAGIALVSVTSLPNNQIRVAVTGADALPVATVRTESEGLVLSVTTGDAPAEEAESDVIQVIVTGAQEEGYVVEDATTATRTDTPLRDIPQSIQIVPQQVIEDQAAIRLQEAVRNVSGVLPGNTFGNTGDDFVIRGFSSAASGNILLDGFRLPVSDTTFWETATIERIEVLKGPASVLYGTLEPGGVVNLVTEQPLSEPFYELEMQAGSYGFLRPSIDLSGPLTDNQNLRYRFNALYERADGFRDYDQDIERFYLAPVLAWEISDRTMLTFNAEYLDDTRPFDRGIINDADFEIPDVPFDRIFGEPDDVNQIEFFSAGYRLEHQLSEDWQLRNAFRFSVSDSFNYRAEPLYDTDAEGNLSRNFRSNDNLEEVYALQTNVVGEFATGSIDHTLLFGVDLSRQTRSGEQRRFPGETPSLNIFDPEYEQIPRPDLDELTLSFFGRNTRRDSIGFYVQDQITLLDNLKLLIGGRFDMVEQETLTYTSGISDDQFDKAFSPRAGIVYQPIEPLSLYASYSRSFVPNSGISVDEEFLEPERGTQYEVGVRGEFFDQRLIANLAAYDLTKTNVATADPDNLDFSIAAGEVKSQGIELDVIGEILDGWNIIASYAYTDARITEDNDPEREGLRLADVPYNAFSLWSTYQIQQGVLEGLGFGAGVFYVGDRIDGFVPSVELDEYWRVDASVFYRRDNWRAAVNLKNLLDEKYIQSGFYNPGEPFTIIGSFAIEF